MTAVLAAVTDDGPADLRPDGGSGKDLTQVSRPGERYEPQNPQDWQDPQDRRDPQDRLAAARAALTRAETATGLRTRLGGPASSGSEGGRTESGAAVPGGSERGGTALRGTDAGAGSALLEDPTRRALYPPGTDQVLPVPAVLAPLFPGGSLARGSIVQVSGSTSVLLALAAAAGADGVWCALAALPHVGWRAAAGAGLALDRVAVVPAPGPDAAGVVGALVDGFDVLVVGRCPALSDRDRRSLATRVRTRGAVLLSSHDWPGANQVLRITRTGWDGLGQGWGHLVGQELTVRATGRGAASGAREVRVRATPDGLRGAVPDGPRGTAALGGTTSAEQPSDGTAAEPARPLLRAV